MFLRPIRTKEMIRNLIYIVFAVALSCFTTFNGFAQEPIKGRVTGKDGKPVSGVTVEVQQTTVSTTTDASGNFEIAANSDDVLIFSKSGYITQQQTTVLSSNVVLLKAKIGAGEDDIVVIPFGERTQRELTYSVSTLKTDALPQLPLSNLNNIFAGRLAGLYVQQNGTQPGNDNASLQIRGRSSYNAVPIRVLVDGVQRDFTDMDLKEVESVTVLKDAASLAWYGLDGGNGVMLITTKKGSKNKTEITFDSQVGLQKPFQFIKPLNSYEYATLLNESYTNIGQTPVYNNQQLYNYQTNVDPIGSPSNNYVNEFLKPAAPVQRYVVSARGGNNAFRYYTLLSYYNQQGLFTPTKTSNYDSNIQFKRLNFRVNVDFDVNKNLTVGLNAGGRSEDRREPNGGGAAGFLNDIYNLPPNAFPILNEDGSYGGSTQFTNNPLGRLQSSGRISNLGRVLFTNLTAKQKLDFVTKGLSANLLFSYDAQGTYQSGFTQNYEVFDFSTPTPIKSRVAAPFAYSGANFSANNRRNEIWAGLDYDRTFGAHDVKASVRVQRSVDNSVERLDYRGQQVSGRVDYGFKERYYLGFVASYSGSENFPPSKRYGFFPAVSAGWIASDEDFLKGVKSLSYLKFRVSYGDIGNGNIGGTRLPFRTLYNRSGSGGYAFGTGFGATSSSSEVNPGGNPNVTWEQIKSFNVGTDIKLFASSLEFSVDYFNQNRTEILTGNSVPGILGISLAAQNGGKATSKGAEVTAMYHKKLGNVLATLNGNFTYAKNEVTARNEDFGTIPYQSSIGFNTGDVSSGGKRFFISQGLFQNFNEIANAPVQTLAGNVVPGDIRYNDVNEDGKINSDDAVSTNYTDIPNMYFGFGFNLSYKNFDFSTQFEGIHGRTIQILTIVNSGPNNLNEFSKDSWTTQNAATAKWPRLAATDRGNNTAASDFWLRSGDFVKLKTLEFGYTIPTKLSQKLKIEKARLYVGGYNLLSFSKLDLDVDPEMPYAGFGSSYPYIKTYTLGLSVQF